MKTYLREIILENRVVAESRVDIFTGYIEEDRKYWEKYHNSKARYFELKEVK